MMIELKKIGRALVVSAVLVEEDPQQPADGFGAILPEEDHHGHVARALDHLPCLGRVIGNGVHGAKGRISCIVLRREEVPLLIPPEVEGRVPGTGIRCQTSV